MAKSVAMNVLWMVESWLINRLGKPARPKTKWLRVSENKYGDIAISFEIGGEIVGFEKL